MLNISYHVNKNTKYFLCIIKFLIFQYFHSHIGLFTSALHIVIALSQNGDSYKIDIILNMTCFTSYLHVISLFFINHTFALFDFLGQIYNSQVQKRSHEPFYQTNVKKRAKRIRSTTIPITKLEKQQLYGEIKRLKKCKKISKQKNLFCI